MSKVAMILFFILGVCGRTSFGHGEDKPGPNNGYLRMPGAYHTELVPSGKGTIEIYILDIQFKVTAADKTKIDATHQIGKLLQTGDCQQRKQHFQCVFPNSRSLEAGYIKLRISRPDSPDGFAEYRLPLSRKS